MAVATTTTVGGKLLPPVWGGALDISSVDLSDEEDDDEVISVNSVHSEELYGDGVCNSPDFDEHNDPPMNDSHLII
jgi:hypothetical protein